MKLDLRDGPETVSTLAHTPSACQPSVCAGSVYLAACILTWRASLASLQRRLILELKPAIVINAAAERRPDVCESDDTGSEALNIESVWYAGRAAAYIGAAFIHISTDYVFDGSSAPYAEDATPHPLNAYGRQKLRGEHAALAAHPTPFILRLPVLFGPTTDLSESAISVFANTVRDAHVPRVLDDWQVRVPTYTPDIGATIARVCDALVAGEVPADLLSGIFHYSSDDCLTRFTIAQLIAELVRLPTDHITRDANPPPGAPRPRDAKLDCGRLKALGLAAPCTPLREALAATLQPFFPHAAAAAAVSAAPVGSDGAATTTSGTGV